MAKIFTIIFLLLMGAASDAETESKLNPDSIYNLETEWTSHSGEKKRLRDFLGEQVVLAMVYTSCKATCPMITNKMREIEKSNSKTKKLKVVMVTFDPARDTPENLNIYFKKMKLGSNWFLLTGTESDSRDLAVLLGVNFKKDSSGEFSHSNVITLLGPDGSVQVQLRSLGEDIGTLVKKVN